MDVSWGRGEVDKVVDSEVVGLATAILGSKIVCAMKKINSFFPPLAGLTGREDGRVREGWRRRREGEREEGREQESREGGSGDE